MPLRYNGDTTSTDQHGVGREGIAVLGVAPDVVVHLHTRRRRRQRTEDGQEVLQGGQSVITRAIASVTRGDTDTEGLRISRVRKCHISLKGSSPWCLLPRRSRSSHCIPPSRRLCPDPGNRGGPFLPKRGLTYMLAILIFQLYSLITSAFPATSSPSVLTLVFMRTGVDCPQRTSSRSFLPSSFVFTGSH